MKRILPVWLLVLALLGAGCQGEPAGSTELSLLAINVRKADALLLRSGNSAYLIDTGTKKSADTMLDVLRREGVTSEAVQFQTCPFKRRPIPLMADVCVMVPRHIHETLSVAFRQRLQNRQRPLELRRLRDAPQIPRADDGVRLDPLRQRQQSFDTAEVLMRTTADILREHAQDTLVQQPAETSWPFSKMHVRQMQYFHSFRVSDAALLSTQSKKIPSKQRSSSSFHKTSARLML